MFGFVSFGNVKNVEKLTKALNDVSFRIYRVFTKVAKFDRGILSSTEFSGPSCQSY